MGVRYESGYSASVEGFLVVNGERTRVAKSNAKAIVLAESCALPPGTVGELLVIIDGRASSRTVTLPDGVAEGQSSVRYEVAAPF